MANTKTLSSVVDQMFDVLNDMSRMIDGEDDAALVRYIYDEETEEVIGEKRDIAGMQKFKKKMEELNQLYETLSSM